MTTTTFWLVPQVEGEYEVIHQMQKQWLQMGAVSAWAWPISMEKSQMTGVFLERPNPEAVHTFPMSYEHQVPFLQLLSKEEFGRLTQSSPAMVEWWYSELGGCIHKMPLMLLTEFMTQTCEECGAIMKVHESASWRVNLHALRCKDCAMKLYEKGYEWQEARYCP